MSKNQGSDFEKALNNANDRSTPLPLLVAAKWGFPLQYHVEDDEYWFSVLDWISGLTGTDAVDASNMWSQRKTQTLISNKTLPYLAADGKTYQRDFTNDIGLYLIAQSLRVTKARPQLGEIKDYLAQAGAFTDLVRREPETVITSGAIDPDEAIDAAINEYRRRGKSDAWINARITGKVKRKMFTEALSAAIADMMNQYYGWATNEIYEGLWGRTAELLRKQLGISTKASLRDNQPTLALTYQGIAEEVSAQKLGNRSELEWEEARQIVRAVSDLIGIQAQATSAYLGVDLATGKPLLEG
ncbi:MAG TPA: hypothetical protein VJZ27_06470 [Aggregatilineales bacterium]|nr:hypothetical protein [Aggregatilineales bacterium]